MCKDDPNDAESIQLGVLAVPTKLQLLSTGSIQTADLSTCYDSSTASNDAIAVGTEKFMQFSDEALHADLYEGSPPPSNNKEYIEDLMSLNTLPLKVTNSFISLPTLLEERQTDTSFGSHRNSSTSSYLTTAVSSGMAARCSSSDLNGSKWPIRGTSLGGGKRTDLDNLGEDHMGAVVLPVSAYRFIFIFIYTGT